MIRTLLNKADRAARDARAGNAQANDFGGEAASLQVFAPQIVVYSGTVATVHRRIVFGIASHGIGAEFA